MWLIKHSRLMGSSDIDNWIREARNSIVCFFNDHVEQPVLSNFAFLVLPIYYEIIVDKMKFNIFLNLF